MKSVVIVWDCGPVSGSIAIRNGTLRDVRIADGKGRVTGPAFALSSQGPCRLELRIDQPQVGPGPDQTLVSVQTDAQPFTFWLRDVSTQSPIFVAAYRVAVLPARDRRSYGDVAAAVQQLGLLDGLATIDNEPEEGYETAAAVTRRQVCPTWLGLSRDMRIFELSYNPLQGFWGSILPRFHGSQVSLPEMDGALAAHSFVLGRGAACTNPLTRRLEDGRLPILHSRAVDDDVTYDLTAFATLESSPLTAETLRGTHYLVADGYGGGHMFTDRQAKDFERLRNGEEQREEETVLCLRTEAVNRGRVPRYAWFRNVVHGPSGGQYDARTGFRSFTSSKRVYAVSRLNGKPLPQDEVALLLQPGEKAVLEFFVPHQPISTQRARRLAKTDFDARHRECRAYWQAKLTAAAQIRVPDPVVDNMISAGLLHLDLVAYGNEPKGSLAACIGTYCPIGSESSPIIQFFDSMGWHDVAERSLGYFLEKQHEDGFIQNFGGYMLETGAALWSMGEHYRHTRDDAWVRRHRHGFVKACEFMLAWRRRNMTPELRGKGYGMQEGKVADPEDPYHSFMLNGYAYLGMKRVGEMLRSVAPTEAKRWTREAASFRKDIRKTFFNVMALSPVVPMGDGTWIPSAPPWAEASGPVALFAEPGQWWTHGTFTGRDSLLGPLYLLLQEVIEPTEQAAELLVRWNAELLCKRNVCLSQPYYCRNDIAHVRRGEVKAFLKMYYNGFTGLADPETYTWWEHYFHASPHKTHEEGWFLMQTRWMLWIEDSESLNLLSLIPRRWMEDGKQIELNQVATYFGPLTLTATSKLSEGRIEAQVSCPGKRRPKAVRIRLPHPDGRKAVSVEGGVYDPDSESVLVRPFSGKARVAVNF